MPFKLDIRSVTVPGCVDGWMALHERFGSIPIERLLAPARALAADGFPASPLLVASLGRLDQPSREQLGELAEQAHARPGPACGVPAWRWHSPPWREAAATRSTGARSARG